MKLQTQQTRLLRHRCDADENSWLVLVDLVEGRWESWAHHNAPTHTQNFNQRKKKLELKHILDAKSLLEYSNKLNIYRTTNTKRNLVNHLLSFHSCSIFFFVFFAIEKATKFGIDLHRFCLEIMLRSNHLCVLYNFRNNRLFEKDGYTQYSLDNINNNASIAMNWFIH